LLEQRADLRAHYQERFRYILVDEFQDANIAQIRLLELLSGPHRNLMAVGDDDQAIYRFRGASYASFDKFGGLFPQARRITLTQNYRSTARVLRVATQLIAQNGTARFDPHKKLVPTQGEGERVRLVEMDDGAHEAAYVAQEIERYHKATGGYAGCAVLYRNHAHRNQLVKTLVRAGVPFVIRGLSVTYSGVVRDLLAYLRVIARPHDNISLARVLAIPAWQVTAEQLLELIGKVRNEFPLGKVLEGLSVSIRTEQTRIGPLLELLAELRARAAELPVSEFFALLLEKLEVRLLPADPDRPYVEAFEKFLLEWEADKSETKRLGELLEYLDYFDEAGGSIELPDEPLDRDAVQLMTVHTAKGLGVRHRLRAAAQPARLSGLPPPAVRVPARADEGGRPPATSHPGGAPSVLRGADAGALAADTPPTHRTASLPFFSKTFCATCGRRARPRAVGRRRYRRRHAPSARPHFFLRRARFTAHRRLGRRRLPATDPEEPTAEQVGHRVLRELPAAIQAGARGTAGGRTRRWPSASSCTAAWWNTSAPGSTPAP
jgi:hypothetical protein